MPGKTFGVLPLPWFTKQLRHQYKDYYKTFSSECLKFPLEFPTRTIVYTDEGQSIFQLEQAVTTYARYFVIHGKYKSVIWLGAENVAVTLNYLCLWMSNREIKVTKNGALRSISDLVTNLFDSIQSECEQTEDPKAKALVIYSAAKQYEAPNSWDELRPFLPDEKCSNIDVMILTDDPKTFNKWLVEVEDPVKSFKVQCRLPSDLIQSFSSRTEEIWQKLLNKHHAKSRRALELVLQLVSFLYPNNMTHAFIVKAIKFIATEHPEDPEFVSKLRKALRRLTESHVLQQVYVGGSIHNALCIDRQFQEQYRATVGEIDQRTMVGTLLRFFVDEIKKRDLSDIGLRMAHPHQVLFLSSGAAKNYQYPRTELTMHQSWLVTVSAAHLSIAKPEMLAINSNSVVEYVNLLIIKKISMFHRKKPLGESNKQVFEGYMYEAPGIKTPIAVKCIPRLHGQGADKKLMREIDSLRKLNSTHVVSIIAVEYEPKVSTYIALEHCDHNLSQWVQDRGLVVLTKDTEDLTQRFKLLKDATEGLKCLLNKGIIHRDIKPANILVKREGPSLIAKLADFDLSKFVGQDASATLTNPFGTEGFRAPELGNGRHRGDHASDMYSFGKVCYFVLSCGNTHFGPVKFPFDFFGAAVTVEALLATDPAERPTAEELSKYPMFWMADKGNHEKFADFVAKVIIEFGTDGSDFHTALKQMELDWQSILEEVYKEEDIEEAINYRQGAGPRKPPPAKKRKEGVGEVFGPNYAGYLRFIRNAIIHAVDRFRDTKSRVKFWNRYMDSATGKPKKWEYFETYFKPVPDCFFTLWKLANDFKFNVSPDNFNSAFKQLSVK